ncbi:tripartite tricarboxylate transporter substrate binding protein [Pseudoroseomonas wenyumeiae]|uniref:Tripartite tricarboxylate transporter substrate binding protein n=2 Tax=Teichococcus wenyumeiae TaxID=2478470 RepID=A0A3A9J5R3_9PROT|nr:tripartite tricarboxylate transporter substrate binding protein [Pseudoroseomonas wenyumeiae]RMI15334.1 tripartite tricarboxylate transporter substrate binding protein [Pseudoroseomonas wenyumeiae]
MAGALGFLGVPAGMQAAAAEGWRPTRPVTLVVPFAGGSATDAVARIIAQLMSEAFGGIPVVVDNRAGANGVIGAQLVARAEPDGHTLLVTTNTTHSANPALLRRLDYDPVADFAPVARIGDVPFMLTVGRNSPFHTAHALLDAARERPGQMSYASGNSTGIVAGATMARQAGIEMLHVPYRSTPPAMTDAMSGRVDCMFVDIAAGLGNVRGGQLRVLALSTAAPSPLLPGVPPLAEAGDLPGFDLISWSGVFAPARTPALLIATLNRVIRGAIEQPEAQARFAEIGYSVLSGTPGDLGRFVRRQLDVWRDLVDAAGIEKE